MKAVFSAPDLLQVTHIKNILATYGIESYIRNTYLSGGMGELPMFECWPQLYVSDVSRYQEAENIIKAELIPRPRSPSWECPHCSELIDGAFDACWKCGAVNPTLI